MCQIEQDERNSRLIEKPLECTDELAISCQNWSLNLNEIRQDPQRVEGDRGDFSQLQKGFISDGVHFQSTGATRVVDKEDVVIRWGKRAKGGFRVVHVEDELEESLDKFGR